MARGLKLSDVESDEVINLSDVIKLSDFADAEPDISGIFGPMVEESKLDLAPTPLNPTVQAPGPTPEAMPAFELGEFPMGVPKPAPVPAVNQSDRFQNVLKLPLEPKELSLSQFADATDVASLPGSQQLPDLMPEEARAGAPYIPEARGIDYSNLTAGDKAKAFGKGLVSGATFGTYQPEVAPGTELYYGAGNIGGNLASGAAITAASMGSAPLAMAGLGGAGLIATANDLKSRGIDPSLLTEPEPMALSSAGGVANAAIPASFGRGRVANAVTGAGLGAGINVGQELAVAGATNTEPDVMGALLPGAALGLGAGIATRPRVPRTRPSAPEGGVTPAAAPPAAVPDQSISRKGSSTISQPPEINLSDFADQGFSDDAVDAVYTAQYEPVPDATEKPPGAPARIPQSEAQSAINPQPGKEGDPFGQEKGRQGREALLDKQLHAGAEENPPAPLKEAAQDPDKVTAREGVLYDENGRELFDIRSERRDLREREAMRRFNRALDEAESEREIPRINLAQRLRRLADRVAIGKMDPEAFVGEADRLANEYSTTRQAARLRKGLRNRERGPNIVRERVLAAARRGEMDQASAEMTLWFVEKNPAVAHDLGISIRQKGNRAAGLYDPAGRIMTLIRGQMNDNTTIHEILHHTERMMPEEARAGILKDWTRSFAREFKDATPERRKALQDILEASGPGKRDLKEQVLAGFGSRRIPSDLYQYFNGSEYWAMNATRILNDRYRASETWVRRARQWLSEFVQKARQILGLKSDAPVIRGLDAILRAEGQLSGRMLAEAPGGLARSVKGPVGEPPPPVGKPPGQGAPPPPPDKPLQELSNRPFDLEPETQWDAFLRRVQDKMRPVKRVQRAIEKTGKKIIESVDTYLAETLFHGRAGNALGQADKRFLEPVLAKMRDYGFTRDQVDDFLLASHAEEGNAQIRRINPDPKRHVGMTDEEAQKVLAKAKEDGTLPQLEEIRNIVDEAVNYGLDYAVREGLISEETAATWRSSYKHYVPTKGFADGSLDDPDAVVKLRSGQGFDIRGPEERRRLGRTGRPDSPLGNVFAQLSNRIVRAEKNRVSKTFLKQVLDNPNKDLWEVNKLTPQQRLEGGIVKRNLMLTRDHPNVVGAKVKGQEYFIFVHDARLAKAMKNLGEEKLAPIMRGMGKVNRFLASVSTTYNPIFVGTNFARDVQTAGINLVAEKGARFTAKVYKDIPKAMAGVWRGSRDKDGEWADWYKRFAAAGGKTEYLSLKSVDDLKADFDAKLNPGAMGQGKEGLRQLGEWVSQINGAAENAIRLATFKNLVEAGMSEARAAEYAKNLTVNFNRKGEVGSFMNAAYLFFNANVQGTARILSVLAKPETRAGKRLWAIAGGLVGSSAAMTIFNRANAGEDEDGYNRYDKLAPFVKERNLIFWFPGDDAPYTIPIPYGYNVLHVLGQSMVDLVMSKRDKDEVGMDVLMAMFSAFNPIGTEASNSLIKGGAKLLSPTQFDPLVQLAVNESYTGRPAMPEQLPFGTPRPQSELYFSSVSPTARKVTQTLNKATGGNEFVSGAVDVSPEALEHLITSYTGGLGKFLYQSWDFSKNTLEGRKTDVSKIPLVRAFKQSKNEYFDQKEFAEKSGRYLQMVRAKENLGDEEAAAFEAKHADEIELGYEARDILKEIEKLDKEVRSIRADLKMTEEQKEAEVKGIRAEQNALRREWTAARLRLRDKASPEFRHLRKPSQDER